MKETQKKDQCTSEKTYKRDLYTAEETYTRDQLNSGKTNIPVWDFAIDAYGCLETCQTCHKRPVLF